MNWFDLFLHIFARREQAERVVPATGITARLTVFASGVMAFLAVFALALTLATGQVSQRWASELAHTATVRISAPAGQSAIQGRAALNILETTPGVVSARILDNQELRDLLDPWLGPDLPLEDLAIPQIIEIVADEDFDARGLVLRLKAEAPGAVLDDHERWRAPLIDAASGIRRIGVLSLVLIGAVTMAMVTLAATAALAANRQIIAVLRLIGAKDAFIVRAFVRRFTLRALTGAISGTAFGLTALLLLPSVEGIAGFPSGLGFGALGWVLAALIPVFTAAVAFFATRMTAMRTVRELR